MLLIFDYRVVSSTRFLYSVVLRESVNVWNLQRWWVSSMIVLEAMTIHFEVATIWVDQLGGFIRVDFSNGNSRKPDHEARSARLAVAFGDRPWF
nr:hypothetical protein [Tanacetum cinerariifolium]